MQKTLPQCSVVLITHLEENKYIDYKIAVREILFSGKIPQYEIAINNGTPLLVLKKTIGLKDTVKVLSLMIAKFVSAFNVSKNMNSEQIADLSIQWIEEESESGSFDCPSYRLEDFALFFELAKTGRYGRPFDYVDASLLNEWLDKYHVERINEYREIIKKKYNSTYNVTPEQEEKFVSAEKINTILQPVIERLKENSIEKEETPEEKERAEQIRKKIVENKKISFNSDYANKKDK